MKLVILAMWLLATAGASPNLWTNFADFYQRATAASKIAFEASRAKNAGDFREQVAKLRDACNSCHAAYQKVD